MASKFTYDTNNKLFILKPGVTSLDAKTEFYSAVKYDWINNAPPGEAVPDVNLMHHRFPIESIGGQPIGGGQTISPYYNLLYGWRIRPAEENSALTIVGNIITAEGDEPFLPTLGAFNTFVTYVVSSNSITSETGGGGLTAADVWDLTNGIEPSLTPRQAMRLIAAASAGKLSGAAGPNVTIRNVGDTKDRIIATVDEDGNRTAVTTDGT